MRASRGGLLNLAVAIFACMAAAIAGTARASSHPEDPKAVVILAIGAPGEEEYGKEFREAAQLWQKTAKTAGADLVSIGLSPDGTNDLQEFRDTLVAQPTNAPSELWIVMLGHGTWDGKEARFNFRGPDLPATELARMLQPFKRPIAVINAASCSGPFLKALAAGKRTNTESSRVVITATRTGSEENYARFGNFISRAIGSDEADLDKDGQTSLLEAYLMASRKTAEFYESEGRLSTEHALLDDNGDGLGTPADWFRGIRAVKKPAEGGAIDGIRAQQWVLVRSSHDQSLTQEQRLKRDSLELRLAQLRDRKASMPETDYYRQLEALLTELAPYVIH